MLLEHKQIIGLPVETKSGQKIGRVSGLIIEAETQTIHQYQINPSGLGKLFTKDFLVQRRQVISIDGDKMVVDDLTEKALVLEDKNQSPKSLPIEAITSDN